MVCVAFSRPQSPQCQESLSPRPVLTGNSRDDCSSLNSSLVCSARANLSPNSSFPRFRSRASVWSSFPFLFLFFFVFCLMKRQVVWLYGQTTELLLALSSVRSAKRRVVLTRKSSVLTLSSHRFSEIILWPPELRSAFQLRPSFLLNFLWTLKSFQFSPFH